VRYYLISLLNSNIRVESSLKYLYLFIIFNKKNLILYCSCTYYSWLIYMYFFYILSIWWFITQTLLFFHILSTSSSSTRENSAGKVIMYHYHPYKWSRNGERPYCNLAEKYQKITSVERGNSALVEMTLFLEHVILIYK